MDYNHSFELQCLSSWFSQIPLSEALKKKSHSQHKPSCWTDVSLFPPWNLHSSKEFLWRVWAQPSSTALGHLLPSGADSWYLIYHIIFPDFSASHRNNSFYLSCKLLPHPNNPILPGLPVLKCSDLKLLSFQPPNKRLVLFPPYKKQSSVGQNLPNFLLWGFPALRPFCLPSLQFGWSEKSQK